MPQTSELSRKQETFLLSLLSLSTLRAAANAAGISEDTGARWLKLPEVQARYQELKKHYIDDSLNELVGHTSEAISCMVGMMKDEEAPHAVRLRAAQLVIENVVELQKASDLEKQIQELKQLIQEKTT